MDDPPHPMTLLDLSDIYINHCHTEYIKPSGRQTRHAANVRSALRHLPHVHADPPNLDELRHWIKRMIRSGLSRRTINDRVSILKTLYRWSALNQLVSPSAAATVQLITGVRPGRPGDLPPRERHPPPDEHVIATISHLPHPLKRAVLVQRLTGMRSTEMLIMHRDNLNDFGGALVYTPREHKTQHHGHTRNVPIPESIRHLVTPRTHSGLVFPSRNGRPYSAQGYRLAVRRAAGLAGVEIWTPSQLRRSAATRIARNFGYEIARQVLGHRSIRMTEHYVRRDIIEAQRIAHLLDDPAHQLHISDLRDIL
ncbi:MAG: hypothetical protein Tsb0013_02500 [Phycisphaerales bacterium]